MQEVTITQYNKLIVNYETFDFTPSSYSCIAINNPWYINCESAPDFVGMDTEANDLDNTFTIAEDVYKINSYSIFVYADKQYDIIDTPLMSHVDLVKYVTNTCLKRNTTFYQPSNHFISINNVWSTYKPSTYSANQHDSILFPYFVSADGAYLGRFQCIPIIQTITATFDVDQFRIAVPDHTVYGLMSSVSSSVNISAGKYTTLGYINTIMNKLFNTGYSTLLQPPTYPYFRVARHVNSFQIYGDEYSNLYGYLHCTRPHSSPTNALSFLSTNSRCLHVPEGSYTVDDFITAVNSNSDDCLFTVESDNKYIYIKADCPFIINPVCKIITEDTDTSETFANKHILLKHPMNKHFTASVTYNGQTTSQEGDYTPAEFLRWIYSVTGVKCTVNNYAITCSESLTVGENPFFEFKDNVVTNLCSLHTLDYKAAVKSACKIVGKSGYTEYNPVLTPYTGTINVNVNSIIPTLNTSNVVLSN